MLELNKIHHGDCLELMKDIPDKSVDMILCDLPYGTTANKWDSIIPFEPLWVEYERIIKDNGAIVLFCSQPFTTKLISSKMELFKYCWTWVKSKPSFWQHAKNRPLQKSEDIAVFSKGSMGHVSLLGEKRMKYFPRGVKENGKGIVTASKHGRNLGARPNQVGKEFVSMTGFPTTVLEYPNLTGKQALHPTQKPVELCEFLIETYTEEKEVVLDNTIGVGTTAIACINTGRFFIGIEKEQEYVDIANERIKQAR